MHGPIAGCGHPAYKDRSHQTAGLARALEHVAGDGPGPFRAFS